MEYPLLIPTLALLGSGAGAFLGSYLKKKGENLATHEDIDKLVDQVAAVTQKTKEIEAKISNEVWDRQRRWEMKKDALFATAQKLAAMNSALTLVHSTYAAAAAMASEGKSLEEFPEYKAKAMNAWNEASVAFDHAQVSTSLVCGEEIGRVIQQSALQMRVIYCEILEGHLEDFDKGLTTIMESSMKISNAIRKELKVDESFRS